ncbi:MAG TPA: hypothetical protein VFI25_14085 [Planctomycetota bacterium]|nr:hypothetical protein [Planctomycetota bacterium]
MRIRIRGIARHRNGISGAPFCAVLFDDEEGHGLVAVVFDEPHDVAVLRVALLPDPGNGVKFGMNSWRGLTYEPALREAIRGYEARQEAPDPPRGDGE